MSGSLELKKEAMEKLKRCKKAALSLRISSVEQRNHVLKDISHLLQSRVPALLKANGVDLQSLPADTTNAFKDRLQLNESRLAHAAVALLQVASFDDPLAEEGQNLILPNGLLLRQVRSPLGVILMIFESRPNVAVEAFSLAFKSGNVLLLRGGKESKNTTAAIYEIFSEALLKNGMSGDSFWGITDPDRDLLKGLLKQRKWIDVVVPRGGEGLIQFTVENSHIPLIKNDRGLCHVYVHEDADLSMATNIVLNAKTQRPGVCNAMETLLVHKNVKDQLLPALYEALAKKSVHWFVCPETLKVLKGKTDVEPAQLKSWDTEYLELKMNCRVVDSMEEAVIHIETHGSGHSEAILTSSEIAARKFQQQVDAAAVYWNASTRFTDGYEFGLGGELGISTQKLHVRGPVGLKELTSYRWLIDGEGQLRN